MASALAPLRDKHIVVLPDLFVDALAFLPSWSETSPMLDQIARRGGGNLPVGPIEFKLGGNAANLALALARLGAQVDLITETDALGRHLLEQAAQGTSLDMDRVRVGPRSSATVGLECDGSNVMLSHAGPLQDFGPDRMEEEDWRRIGQADAVAMVNWAQNGQGTRLLDEVARRTEGFLYLDTGDPRHRPDEAARLVEDAPRWKGIGAWGMNENEVGAFTGDALDLLEAAQGLARRLDVRVDLHTRELAAAITKDDVVQVPAEPTPARRLTGAGDTWNAGNLAGQLLGWQDAVRLRFAHQVATRFVTGNSGLPPTAEDMEEALPVLTAKDGP